MFGSILLEYMYYDSIYLFYLGAITNHYIGFCDDRHINPVDGDISEILFYLDYVYPKTLVKVPDNEKIIEAKVNTLHLLLIFKDDWSWHSVGQLF